MVQFGVKIENCRISWVLADPKTYGLGMRPIKEQNKHGKSGRLESLQLCNRVMLNAQKRQKKEEKEKTNNKELFQVL